MKKLFYFFPLVLLCLNAETFAQDRKQSGFGLRFGYNASNLTSYGSDSDFSFRYGPMGGVYFRLGIFPNFSIQPEILYSQQGTRFDNPSIPQSTVNDRLNYINLPVLFQFWFSDKLNFHIGPYLGFLIDVASEGRNTISANYERWDVGGTVGAEYDLPFGLNFGARYNLGFLNVAGEDHNAFITGGNFNEENTNQFVQVYIGWTF